MTDVHTQINTTSGSNESEGAAEEYLTFILAGEEYGLEILRVQEIKGWDEATVIPNTPEYILGVINLRGTIVPIIDLRKRFNLAPRPSDRAISGRRLGPSTSRASTRITSSSVMPIPNMVLRL